MISAADSSVCGGRGSDLLFSALGGLVRCRFVGLAECHHVGDEHPPAVVVELDDRIPLIRGRHGSSTVSRLAHAITFGKQFQGCLQKEPTSRSPDLPDEWVAPARIASRGNPIGLPAGFAAPIAAEATATACTSATALTAEAAATAAGLLRTGFVDG